MENFYIQYIDLHLVLWYDISVSNKWYKIKIIVLDTEKVSEKKGVSMSTTTLFTKEDFNTMMEAESRKFNENGEVILTKAAFDRFKKES